MTIASDIYEKQIKPLSAIERLNLVKLIMDDLADTATQWVVDSSDSWSEQDLYDVRKASLRYAAHQIADGEDDAQSG
jgi:hypothetical protein